MINSYFNYMDAFFLKQEIYFVLLFTHSSPCRKDQFAVLYFEQDSYSIVVIVLIHPTSSPGLFPPHPFFEGKALGTRLWSTSTTVRSCTTQRFVAEDSKICSLAGMNAGNIWNVASYFRVFCIHRDCMPSYDKNSDESMISQAMFNG